MSKKTFKVLIEIPEDWFDIDSPILYASAKIRDEARQAVKDAIIEQYLSKIVLPDIQISRDELKEVLLNRMADSIFRKKREDGDFNDF